MRSKFKWIFTLLLAFSMQFSFAQEKTVTGVVSDEKGTLPGANVVVKGTAKGVQTDMDGNYAIKVKQGDVLVFSFVGMKEVQKTVGASNTISVTLVPDNLLTEVFVDGYRSTNKRTSSAAQSTISSKVIENRPNVTFIQSLQAQVPGLNISSSSGSPGTAKVQSLIRGISSLNGSNDPLIVIDGVPSNQTVFRSINPNDIESATVLKDAAATAIYGNRASAGVIVVKTKGGSYDSKLTFKYSGSTGFTTLQDHDYNVTNTREILTLERTAFEIGLNGSGLGATGGVGGGPMTDAEINAYPIDVKWKDYFFQTGITTNHDISMTGGNANMTNFTSLGYFDQEGIVPTTDFKRFTLRSNFTGKSSNGKFTYGTNIFGSYSKRNQLDQETRTDINANVLQNPLQGLLSSLPYLDPNVYQNGQQLFNDFGAPSFQITPYMLLDYLTPGTIPRIYDETKLLINFNGNYKLGKYWSVGTRAGVDYASENLNFARAPHSYLAIVATPAGAEFGGIETQSNNRDFTFNLVNNVNFKKIFGEKHTIEANAFIEYVKGHRKFFSYTQTGLDPRTWSLGAGTGYVPFNTATPTFYRPTVAALKRDAGLFSYFGTFDYDYDSRFGVAATVRRDASYKFVDENRWGTFYSASARWNMDREAFLQNTIFKELKLRASYGTTGNQNIPANAFGANAFYLGSNLVRDTNSSQVGYANSASLGPAVIANSDIMWETTTQINFGLDFNINNRFSGSLDVYKKNTKDLFDDITTSSVTSIQTIDGNNGEIQNKGIEVLLKYDVFKKGDFKLDLFANGSYNKATYKNTLVPGNADEPNGNVIRYVDGLINEYYVVPVYGINPANGNLLFVAADGSITETISDDDRQKSGKSNIPTYVGGFGFNASYKGFFLNTQFSFVADVYRFDFDLTNLSDPTQIGTFPVTNDLLDAWSPTNPSQTVPSLTATNLVDGDTFSDRWVRDASYLRLKVLTVGYNVPAKFLDKTAIKSVRFYSLLENYLTWTKWRGFDAETVGASNQGGYPAPKTVSFGVDFQF